MLIELEVNLIKLNLRILKDFIKLNFFVNSLIKLVLKLIMIFNLNFIRQFNLLQLQIFFRNLIIIKIISLFIIHHKYFKLQIELIISFIKIIRSIITSLFIKEAIIMMIITMMAIVIMQY